LTLRELARRRNSLLLELTVLALILFGAFLLSISNFLWWVARGPEPVTFTQLSEMGTEAAGKWFDVTAEVQPVHLLQTTSRSRKGATSVTNHFALIGSKAVVVQTERSALSSAFLAWASEFDENNAFYNGARRRLNDGGGARIPFSPLLLTVSVGGVTSTRWFVTSAISIVVILLLIPLWRLLRAMQDFTRTPQIARLRKSVRASEGLPALIAEIDKQLAAIDPDPNTRRRGPILLPSWIIGAKLSVMSSSDVIWVAPYVVVTKLYGMVAVSVSKQHTVRVISRTGQTVQFQAPAGSAGEVLTIFHQWAPWAVIGADPAMETRFGPRRKFLVRLFSRHPSRAKLIAAVDKRREQFLAMRAAQMGRTGTGPAAR
jgi:hypothetical protein